MTSLQLNPSSGTPLYIQLVAHLRHSIETGAIRAGEQLPSVRKLAEDLLINPNTVVRAYRELESEGILVLKHGSGVFVRDSVVARTELMKKAEPVLRSAVGRLEALGLDEDEIRRLMENELAVRRSAKQTRKKHA
ncbi:MAG TPA: GntR family transcriptional regulator [Gammaproteobacteria bacterium]|nr:GntR family transcriptional regulator [Gammaproteobacteria bacterium]